MCVYVYVWVSHVHLDTNTSYLRPNHVHMVAMFILSHTVPLTLVPQLKEGKGAARERGGVQSESLLALTSCFSCRDVPSPWRPSGTRSLSVPPFFKGVAKPQEISLTSLRGNQSIS